MEYLNFLAALRKNHLYIFSMGDIFKYFPKDSPKTIQNQLQLWTAKGLLMRLRRNVYQIQFPEGGPVLPDLYMANRIYEPSYVSLQTALSFYSLIPDVAASVTSVTTRQTKLFKTPAGGFHYRSCKNETYCGYEIVLYEGYKIYMAEKEKALVDYIYFKQRHGEEIDIEVERFDNEKLEKLSWKKIFHYASLYNHKTLLTTRKMKGELK